LVFGYGSLVYHKYFFKFKLKNSQFHFSKINEVKIFAALCYIQAFQGIEIYAISEWYSDFLKKYQNLLLDSLKKIQ